MNNKTCGQCKYYQSSKNKKIGICKAPLPYYVSLEYKDWYVTHNDIVAELCDVYKPMWENLEGCVVYD